MTDYFPITPIGLDTEEVESLPSFLSRIAALHGLSICQMVRHLSAWWAKTADTSCTLPEAQIYTMRGTGLSGYGPNVDIFVDVLGAATGSSLVERTSVRCLRPAASVTCARSVKSVRSWCPACFSEQLHSGNEIHDKLVWALHPVERCSIHQLKLETACPHCASVQHFYHRSGRVLLCFRCGASLASDPSTWTRVIKPALGESDCADLAKEIATGRLRWAECNAFCTFDKELEATLSPLRWRVKSIAPPSGSLKAVGRSSPPNLYTMLRRSQAAGVRLVDILSSPIEAAKSAGVLELERCGIAVPVRFKHSAEAAELCRERLRQELESARTCELPGLPSLATDLGVSEGFVRYNCSGEVKLYLKERQARIVGRTLRLRRNVEKVLLDRLLPDYRSGVISSQKRLVELAESITGAKKYIVRGVLASLAKKRDVGIDHEDLNVNLDGALIKGLQAKNNAQDSEYRREFIKKVVDLAMNGDFSPSEIASANNLKEVTVKSWIAARRCKGSDI